MPSEKVAETPNILLMMVDQMRFDAMACAGNKTIRTPNLDRLAQEGMRFSQAYSPCPVCIPARHGLLTGQPCSVHGHYDNVVPHPEQQLPYLAELLGLDGYHTRAIGKMHFRPVRRHHGFQRMELMEEIADWREDDEYLCYLQKHGYGHVREVHGIRNMLFHLPQVSIIPEKHHGSTWVADRTTDYLRHNVQNGRRPFFVFSSWIAPHPPWNPPEPFASMYDLDSLPLPVGWEQDLATIPPYMHKFARYADVKEASPQMLRRIKALYYGSISLIDKGIGRILDTMDELGLSENTLVIFTSDHGEMLGDHHCFQKLNPYEPSAHIPLLMRMPDCIKAGTVCDDLVSLLDVMPTCLDLAGIEYPAQPALLGSSLLGRSGGGLADPRSELVMEFGQDKNRWLSLRQGEWKYNYYLFGGWEELFNLNDDPYEANNLLLEPELIHVEHAHEMKVYLQDWEHAHGFASSFTVDGEFKSFVPPTKQPPIRINGQFPRWVARLNPSEASEMQGMGEELLAAMQHETTYSLETLRKSGSLQQWQGHGGTLPGTGLDETGS